MELERINAANTDFLALVKQLDAYLATTDGDEHAFYDQFNSVETISHVVLCTINSEPVGCGAFKPYDTETAEIKRMFTKSNFRGRGIASSVLNELESWARDIGYTRCILETGNRQKEAVVFYKRRGYEIMPKYGQYEGMENSLCFTKAL